MSSAAMSQRRDRIRRSEPRGDDVPTWLNLVMGLGAVTFGLFVLGGFDLLRAG
jgi:hypothetical protein